MYLNDTLQLAHTDENEHVWYGGWGLWFCLHICLLFN